MMLQVKSWIASKVRRVVGIEDVRARLARIEALLGAPETREDGRPREIEMRAIDPIDAVSARLREHIQAGEARVTAGLEKLGADAALLKNVKTYEKLDAIAWPEIDLVIEAATENIELKRKIFSELETLARPDQSSGLAKNAASST